MMYRSYLNEKKSETEPGNNRVKELTNTNRKECDGVLVSCNIYPKTKYNLAQTKMEKKEKGSGFSRRKCV